MHNTFKNNIKIKVLGIGGCGNNSIKTLMEYNLPNVEYIALNTDAQSLSYFDENKVIYLGDYEKRKGFGAGSNPKIGFECALESQQEIEDRIKDADIVIIAAGMGKGTGTGASKVVAEIAKKTASLVIAVVTTPFEHEGERIKNNALQGIEELKKIVDGLIIVSNQKLLANYGSVSNEHSLKFSNTILEKTLNIINEIINEVGVQNVDFADLLFVTKNKGEIIMNDASASGKDRAEKAAQKVIFSNILEHEITGCTDVIVNISGSAVTFQEISLIIDLIKNATGENVNIIQGLISKNNSDKSLKISLVASGLERSSNYYKNLDLINNTNSMSTLDSQNTNTYSDSTYNNNESFNSSLFQNNSISENSTTFNEEEEDNSELSLPSFLKNNL
ncbi:cell division protein FtsZ [Mycoplasma sp. 480]|uniref:cell division protein FtsZ n=1 Tax=Mycoplasma sp. 480 TaxID=3440155 RepID=UPI003F5190E0